MSVRRLAAILVADVVGFSRLVGADEAGTLARLATLRREIVEPSVARHAGRLFKQTGDGFLVEFASAVQAVTCAIEIQKAAGADSSLPLRIGIHVGDVVVEGDDLMGDGVNIAARIEGVAEPGGIAVSRAVHEQVRDRLDASFVDKGEIALKNIGRPVHVFAVGGKTTPAAAALALPDKPSIAVLPFQNMSGDPEQEYFADGMVEDIITALSRFKSLFVIARNSSFSYKGKSPDIRQVGRELGVRYVLEGSVRKAGGKVRITGQLIDSETGAHLWADRFDGSLEDVFELQDQVTTSVVGAVAPRVDQAEIERARRKPVESLDAYDCFLRGLASANTMTREAQDEALRHFYRAIEIEPRFSAPYGMAARTYIYRQIQGWVVDKAREEAECRSLAQRISAVGQDDALALCSSGLLVARILDEYDKGAALIDQGLAINQNLAAGWRNRAIVSSLLGDQETALVQFAHALRLSPLDPEIWRVEGGMASASFLLGNYNEALGYATRALARQPNFALALRAAAAASALGGDIDAARKFVIQLRSLDPAIRLTSLQDYLRYRKPTNTEAFARGLRLAGLPE